MTAIPDMHYAHSGVVAIAYEVLGDGPVDVVFVPFFCNIRWAWEQPLYAHVLPDWRNHWRAAEQRHTSSCK